MGVLSEIIIARPDEAASINAAAGAHDKRWPTLPSKGIDTIKLGTLSQILMDRDVNDIDVVATFMLDAILDEASEEGPWIFLVPDELVSNIATIEPATTEQIATRWAATEEFQLSGWPVSIVAAFLHELIAHTKRARVDGKSLLLWMSL